VTPEAGLEAVEEKKLLLSPGIEIQPTWFYLNAGFVKFLPEMISVRWPYFANPNSVKDTQSYTAANFVSCLRR
jgi:hypothetical protein